MTLSSSKLVVKKINSNIELVNCAYCGSFNYQVLFTSKDRIHDKQGEYPIVKCKECGLVYLNPRPNKNYLSNYYYKDYFGHKPAPSFNNKKHPTFKEKVFNFLSNKTLTAHFGYNHLSKTNLFWKILTFPFKKHFFIDLTPFYISNGRLLEVGCSYGWRLEKLRSLGWEDCMGVELSEQPVNFARDKGLNVICKPIEDTEFQDNTFDVIIASMVMEHLREPFFLFEKLHKWLKPGGQLLFSVPNISGLEYKIFKKYWYPLQVPYHFYHFSDNFIKKNLDKYNVKIHYQKVERDIIASLRYFIDDNKRYRILLILLKFPRICYKVIENIFSFLKKSSRISIYAVKKDL